MLPVDFEGSNLTLTKPQSMTDEECGELKAYKGQYDDGTPFFITHWQPSKEDLEALNAGRGLWLNILGSGFPPVALFTKDENNEVN